MGRDRKRKGATQRARDPAPRRRRRRRIGAAIAIFVAFAVGVAGTWSSDTLLWGIIGGLGAGGLTWGISLLGPGAEVALAEIGDEEELGEGLSGDGIGDS